MGEEPQIIIMTPINFKKIENESAIEKLPDPRLPLEKKLTKTLQENFTSQDPNRIAIKTEAEAWTYHELKLFSARLASRIIKDAEGRQGVVAIYAERNAALIIAMLGVLQARLAFVILDAKYAVSRNVQLIELAKPCGIINATSNSVLPPKIERVIGNWGGCFTINLPYLNGDIPKVGIGNNRPETKDEIDAKPDDLMYTSFTSGTQGFPKLVLGSQIPVTHFIQWQINTFDLKEDVRVSMLSGLSHDPLLRDVFLPLSIGGTICIPNDECFNYPGRLFEWAVSEDVSVMHLTPSMGHFFLTRSGDQRNLLANSLKYVFFGGDILTNSLVERFRECAPNTEIINCYGATETPQVMSFHLVPRNMSHVETIPIGKGIDGVQLLLFDETLKLCKPGVKGEICIRTPYRALEIRDLGEKPNHRFLINPYTELKDDLIYCTGDFGVYLPDGTVVFKGRKDSQVKVRGYRLDLFDYENTLQKSELVSRCIADVDITPDGNTSLVLYIASSGNRTANFAELRQLIAKEMPTQIFPDRIIHVKDMPLTPNGKIDKKKLRQVKYNDQKRDVDLDSRENGCEEGVLRLLGSVSGIGSIDANQPFTEIGINSLQIVELSSLIEEEFGISISIKDLLGARNISQLSKLILNKKQTIELSDVKEKEIGAFEETGKLKTYSYEDSAGDRIFNNETKKVRSSLASVLFNVSNETILRGALNRLLQIFSRVAPDSLRVYLHRLRGVSLGKKVSIGYDTVIETSYPKLVYIGNDVNIGMRVTIIAHFRGMTEITPGIYSVKILDGAFIGPGVIILPNVTIGDGAVISAGSVVASSIPAMTFAHGNPATAKAKCGLPLTGKTSYHEFLNALKLL